MEMIEEDESEIIYMRKNIREEDVYRYSVKIQKEEEKEMFI